MFPSIDYKQTNLTGYDILAIRKLYGARGEAKVRIPRICHAGRFYCGRQLETLRYENVDHGAIYECDYNGNALFLTRCLHGCNAHSTNAFCSCHVGAKYCGHELRHRLMWNFESLTDNLLYQCIEYNNVKTPISCPYHCVENELNDSACSHNFTRTCNPGRRYCGYELYSRSFKNVRPQALYECNYVGNRIRHVEMCTSGCIGGEPSRCGVDRMVWPRNIP